MSGAVPGHPRARCPGAAGFRAAGCWCERRADVGETGRVFGEAPVPLMCSARGCRATAVWALRWNNPRLHPPGAAQDVAGLRESPRRARTLPRDPRLPPGGRRLRRARRGRPVTRRRSPPRRQGRAGRAARAVLAAGGVRRGRPVDRLRLPRAVAVGPARGQGRDGAADRPGLRGASGVARRAPARPPPSPCRRTRSGGRSGPGGRIWSDATVVVRNRPNENGEFGYEVVVPFRVDGGPVLLVDRGWIPNGASGARPDAVPAPPPGKVTIVARLRPTEPPEHPRRPCRPGRTHRRPRA